MATIKHKILPIEVKAGKNGALKSLHYVLSHNPYIERTIVFSLAKKGVEDKIEFVPFYWAGEY